MKILYTAFIIIILSACGKLILEDRGECPSLFTIDLKNIGSNVNELTLWIFDSKKQLVKKEIIPNDYFGGEYLITVPRDFINYYVWGNLKDGTILNDDNSMGSYLTNLDKFQPDSLYFYSNNLNVNDESVNDIIVLSKEFITINLKIVGSYDTSGLSVVGTTSNAGFFINGSLVNKQTSIDIKPKEISSNKVDYIFRITRQDNLDDILLKANYNINNSLINVFDLPLSKYISDSNYDMKSKNLEDIYLTLDISSSFIIVKIDDWVRMYPVDIKF